MTFLHHYPSCALGSINPSTPSCGPPMQPQGRRMTIVHLMPPLLPQKKEPGPQREGNRSHIKALLRGRGGVRTEVWETSRNPVI